MQTEHNGMKQSRQASMGWMFLQPGHKATILISTFAVFIACSVALIIELIISSN